MNRRHGARWNVLTALLLSLPVMCGLIGCTRRIEYGSVNVLEFSSTYLDKDMRIMVSLPDGFFRGGEYAVLYFIPYGGGGAGLVTHLTNSDPATVRVLQQNTGKPLIIVGVPHDGSFLLDSEPPYEVITGTSGIRFTAGRYESYFLHEVVPRVEREYALHPSAAARYIGGYSMGGYAALRIGLSRPDLFSRIGAHSPTLFVDSLPDQIATRFMYPTEVLRAKRDPLLLELNTEALSETVVYIDTGSHDINREACELMHQRLIDAGVTSDLRILSGFHGATYLQTHMPEYMRFYTTVAPE